MEYLFEIVVGLGITVTSFCLIEIISRLKQANAYLRTINEISLVNFYDMVQKGFDDVKEIKSDVDDIRGQVYDLRSKLYDMEATQTFKDFAKD